MRHASYIAILAAWLCLMMGVCLPSGAQEPLYMTGQWSGADLRPGSRQGAVEEESEPTEIAEAADSKTQFSLFYTGRNGIAVRQEDEFPEGVGFSGFLAEGTIEHPKGTDDMVFLDNYWQFRWTKKSSHRERSVTITPGFVKRGTTPLRERPGYDLGNGYQVTLPVAEVTWLWLRSAKEPRHALTLGVFAPRRSFETSNLRVLDPFFVAPVTDGVANFDPSTSMMGVRWELNPRGKYGLSLSAGRSWLGVAGTSIHVDPHQIEGNGVSATLWRRGVNRQTYIGTETHRLRGANYFHTGSEDWPGFFFGHREQFGSFTIDVQGRGIRIPFPAFRSAGDPMMYAATATASYDSRNWQASARVGLQRVSQEDDALRNGVTADTNRSWSVALSRRIKGKLWALINYLDEATQLITDVSFDGRWYDFTMSDFPNELVIVGFKVTI